MIPILKRTVKFSIVMLIMTIIYTIVWDQVVAAKIYDCTDSVPFGYLRPGDWVHSWTGHPMATVSQVVHGRSMSEPDTIKEGWSVSRLWYLWLVFATFSLVVSFLLARVAWIKGLSRLLSKKKAM